MTPGARTKAAMDLYEEIGQGDSPADTVLDAYFRSRRYVGARDRRQISARVYSMLRCRSRLDWWVSRICGPGAIATRTRAIADLVLNDNEPAEAMPNIFNGARHCPDEISGEERMLAAKLQGQPLEHADMPDCVRFEYPEWLDREFRAAWGVDLASQLAAYNQQAAMDLRVNRARASREAAKAALMGEGVISELTRISPVGLRVSGRARMGGVAAYRDGLVEIQDEGSQLLSLLAGAKPGMTVIDFCAGAGGKTLALADDMDGLRQGGRLIACDISAKRLHRMGGRLKRAGLDGVERITLQSESDAWVEKNQAIADVVFLDVPCSGTGTWRRSPELRWRTTEAELTGLWAVQKRILASACRLVKPGGRLVYATCSVLPSENEAQVDWFLEGGSDFKALPIATAWAETVGGACPASGPYLRLSPARDQTDGFFLAILERV